MLRADHDLAAIARRRGLAVLAANDDLDASRRPADAGILAAGCIPSLGLVSLQHRDGIEHFAFAVGDPHYRAEDGLCACVEGRFQSCRAAEYRAQ